MTPLIPTPFLSEEKWQRLIEQINIRQVVPIIGPELSMVPNENGKQVPLLSVLASRLAKALNLPDAQPYDSLSRVVSAHLLKEPPGDRREIYVKLKLILRSLQVTPPPALSELARIDDFDLFITSSVDPLLMMALTQSGRDFDGKRNTLDFHPSNARDLPDPLPAAFLFHILGSQHTNPDFAVWEDDEMEFICGLIEHRDNLKNLFRQLQTQNLLFIGAPFTDWVVRFFLRAARKHQLSDPMRSTASEYIAARQETMGEPMVFFFDKFVRTTTVIKGDPSAFALELAARWQAQSAVGGSDDEFMTRLPDNLPRGFVFISYSHDDRTAAIHFARRLTEARIPVWLDKQRLQAGEHYENRLMHTVKNSCSFFISLVSVATENDSTRYVHKERAWAAERAVPSYVFYIPVVIDDTRNPKLEPRVFEKLHHYRAAKGEPDASFLALVRAHLDKFRNNIDVRS